MEAQTADSAEIGLTTLKEQMKAFQSFGQEFLKQDKPIMALLFLEFAGKVALMHDCQADEVDLMIALGDTLTVDEQKTGEAS